MGHANLPLAGAEKHARTFERLGWTRRQGKGSHIVMSKRGVFATLSIPNHKGQDVKRALLAKLLQAAGISEDDYLAAFNR